MSVFISGSRLAFLSRPKGNLLPPLLCLCWTVLMFYTWMHLCNAYTRSLLLTMETYYIIYYKYSPYMPLFFVYSDRKAWRLNHWHILFIRLFVVCYYLTYGYIATAFKKVWEVIVFSLRTYYLLSLKPILNWEKVQAGLSLGMGCKPLCALESILKNHLIPYN